MTLTHSLLFCILVATAFLSPMASSVSAAQAVQPSQPTDTAPCILAGRINAEGSWAPLANGLRLLNADGKPLAQQGKAALASAKAVVLSKGALLAQCNGNQAIPSGEGGQGSKSPAPALSAGSDPIPILSVAYAPVRAGGQWVEIKLDVPHKRVVMASQ